MIDKKIELFNCGKELFSEKGFKDTSVSDITKRAKMAVGTFYNYYISKEKLFMEIFMSENVKLKQRVIGSLDFNKAPVEIIKELVYINIKGMNENPILKEWNNRDVYSKIEQIYRDENGMGQFDFLFDSFAEIIQKWQDEGKIRRDINVSMIMAFFTAIITVDAHKEEVGIQYFPEIMDYLTDFIMKGIATDSI